MQEITVILLYFIFYEYMFAADVEKCFAYLCLKMSHDTQQGYQIQKMLIRPISDQDKQNLSEKLIWTHLTPHVECTLLQSVQV